jgi:hypothetical protein
MFGEFMRVWEATQPSASESDEPQSARQAQLDRLREAMERGPGGDVDVDGRVTRTGLCYVPGLKRTVSMWLRMRERYEQCELGGELDGLRSILEAKQRTHRTERGESARSVCAPVLQSKRPVHSVLPVHQAHARRDIEPSAWDDLLDRDLRYMVLTWLNTVLWEFVLLGALAIWACATFDAAATAWLIGFVGAVLVAAIVVTVVIIRARAKHDNGQLAARTEEAEV